MVERVSGRNYSILLGVISALSYCNVGYDVGIVTSVGPILLKQTAFTVTDVGVELFFGTLDIAALLGALVSNVFSDWMGRRSTLILSEALLLVGIVGQSIAQNYGTLIFFRAITGLGMGMVIPTSAIYIGEVVSTELRGKLVSWVELYSNVGLTISFALGYALSGLSNNSSWRIMIALGALIPALLLVCLLVFMPESPRWLIKQNRGKEALAVLTQIHHTEADGAFEGSSSSSGRGSSLAAEQLVADIRSSISAEENMLQANGWEAIFSPTPAVRAALLAGLGAAVVQQLAAPAAITSYLLFMFHDAGVAIDQQYLFLIGVGLVRILTVYVASQLFDQPQVGRRSMMLTSGIGIVICMVLYIILFGVISINGTNAGAAFSVVATTFLYVVAYEFGYGPGPYVIMSEVFPLHIRAKAFSLGSALIGALAAAIDSSFLSLVGAVSYAGFFFIFGALSSAGVLLVYFTLPETGGVSLEEVGALFERQVAARRSSSSSSGEEQRLLGDDDRT